MVSFLRKSTSAAALLFLVIARGHAQAPQQQQPPQQQSGGQQTGQQQTAGQAGQDPQQPPTFRAGINYVRVDVIITDKAGNNVGDLQQSDFEVVEDGKPQKIESFKLVKLDGGKADAIKEPPKQIRTDYDEEAEAARDDVRLFAIFLDDYHVRRGASMGPMRELPVTATDDGQQTLDLSLAGLAVGEYVVEVSASSSAGEAKDVVDFRVTT